MGASGLGALLVKEGLLSEQDRQTIARTCGQRSWAFAKSILATGMLDEDELAAFFAENTKFEVAPRGFIQHIDRDLLDKLDGRMIARLEVLPIQVDWEYIHVAVVDPLDKSTISQLEFFTGLKVIPVIAPISEIYRGIQRLVPDFKPHFNALSSFMDNHASNAWQKQRLDGRFAHSSEITNEFQKIEQVVNKASQTTDHSSNNQIPGKTLYQQPSQLENKTNQQPYSKQSFDGLIDDDINLDIIEDHDDVMSEIDHFADNASTADDDLLPTGEDADSYELNNDFAAEHDTSLAQAPEQSSNQSTELNVLEELDKSEDEQAPPNNLHQEESLEFSDETFGDTTDFAEEADLSTIGLEPLSKIQNDKVTSAQTSTTNNKSKIDLEDEENRIDFVNFQKYSSRPDKKPPFKAPSNSKDEMHTTDKSRDTEASQKARETHAHNDQKSNKGSKPNDIVTGNGASEIGRVSGIINQALVKLSLASNIDTAIETVAAALSKMTAKGSIVLSKNPSQTKIICTWHESKTSDFTKTSEAETQDISDFYKSLNFQESSLLEDNHLGYTYRYYFPLEQAGHLVLFVSAPENLLSNDNISPMIDDLFGRFERILSQNIGADKAG